MSGTALVVTDAPGDTTELDHGLADSGFAVRHAAPEEVTGRPELLEAAEVVLVSASVGLQRVALLAQRAAGAADPPAVLVFGQHDAELLEACARAGFDYVTPPFRPGLLRSRMASAGERGQLLGAVGELASEASLRAYEREMGIARDIQAGFLPERLPSAPGWEVTARFRPVRDVGGDFYDGFELVGGQRLGFVVADVCGKGVGAALFMALIRTLLRHTAEQTGAWQPTEEIVGIAAGGTTAPAEPVEPVPPRLSLGAGPLVHSMLSTNRYLTRNHLQQGYFVTVFFAVVDPVSGALLYVNAGHNPPVLLRDDGEHMLLHPTGPAVGLLPDGAYSLGWVVLDPGDTLLLYTDGVVEARDTDGRLFGTPRLLDVLPRPASSAEAVLTAVDDALRDHVGATEQSDDITMLALRRSGRL